MRRYTGEELHGFMFPDYNRNEQRWIDGRERDAELERLRADKKRLDFIEKHLFRAGDVVDKTGKVIGIMKCWQVVTQADDSLRTTVDLLSAALAKEAP